VDDADFHGGRVVGTVPLGMMLLLAQSGWSAADSANLQQLHDWFSQLFDPVGFEWGLGTGITFGLSFLIVYSLRKVFSETED